MWVIREEKYNKRKFGGFTKGYYILKWGFRGSWFIGILEDGWSYIEGRWNEI